MPQLVSNKQMIRFRRDMVSNVVFSGVDILTIGRAVTNDIGLPDPAQRVSRYHAAIVRSPGSDERYFLRDLGSLRSTQVNGETIYQRLLKDGDAITIAGYELIYFQTAVEQKTAEGEDLIEVVSKRNGGKAGAASPFEGTTVLFTYQELLKEIPLTHEKRDVLEALLGLARSSLYIGELFEQLMEPILHVMNAERGFVALFDEGARQTHWGIRGLDRKRGERIKITDPSYGERLRRGECVQEESTLLVPLLLREEGIGFICVDRPLSTSPFSKEDLEFLLLLGRLATARTSVGPAEKKQAERAIDPAEIIEWPRAVIGKSKKMQEVYRQIREAAGSSQEVLLYGETGTGKELVAKAIHDLSSRKDKPYVIVDLTSIGTGEMADSTLFGHLRGAYSAPGQTTRKGRFELADKGTIFLDELSSLELKLQEKLLRPIQEGEIQRVGDEKLTKVDVKVIAATNVDPEDAVRRGVLRSDLYQRLKGRMITLPPLRERQEDIPLLAHYFLDRFAKQHCKRTRGISHTAMRQLLAFPWPGNVRELENCIMAAVSRDKEVLFSWEFNLKNQPTESQRGEGQDSEKAGEQVGESQKPKRMDEFEKEKIMEVLGHTGGNLTKAAELLGIARMTLLNKMDKYGIARNYGKS